MPVIAQQHDERGSIAEAGHQVLVLLTTCPRRRGAADAGRVLRPLAEEAAAVLEVLELVREAGVRSAPPRAQVLAVRAEDRERWMKPETAANRRAADL